jgi:hypothetical protein
VFRKKAANVPKKKAFKEDITAGYPKKVNRANQIKSNPVTGTPAFDRASFKKKT